MNSPCELLIDGCDEALASDLFAIAKGEAHRIEEKYSRYRTGNLVESLNEGRGAPQQVD